MQFTVNALPQGKARARTATNKYTGKTHSYTPKKTQNYEDLVRWSYKAAGGEYLGEVPIKLYILAIYQIPTSWSKKKKQQAINGEILPCVKPDGDNCAKAVMDALNGVCWLDDKQVVDLHIEKIYGTAPRLEITVLPM